MRANNEIIGVRNINVNCVYSNKPKRRGHQKQLLVAIRKKM